MTLYSALSKFYDLLMYDFNYKGIINKLGEKYSFNGKKGMDLCCGTGNATLMLSGMGADVTAMDNSIEMLNIAYQKASQIGARVKLIAGDINDFEYGQQFDFICSVCDGLNYLEPTNFSKFLQKSYVALKSTGLLFFDVSTKYKAERVLDNGLFYEDADELTYFYTTKYNKKEAYVDAEVVIFEHTGADRYIRSQEQGRQYFYDTGYILEQLTKTGFRWQSFDGDKLSTLEPNSLRLLVIAYKD